MTEPSASTIDEVKLRAEAEFAVFDGLPSRHREHLRTGGRINGYDEAVDREYLRRYLAAMRQKGATP